MRYERCCKIKHHLVADKTIIIPSPHIILGYASRRKLELSNSLQVVMQLIKVGVSQLNLGQAPGKFNEYILQLPHLLNELGHCLVVWLIWNLFESELVQVGYKRLKESRNQVRRGLCGDASSPHRGSRRSSRGSFRGNRAFLFNVSGWRAERWWRCLRFAIQGSK